jgi:hypothetical protein
MTNRGRGPDTTAEVARARAHFFAGEIDAAAAIFQRVLAGDRHHPEALHFCGVIAYLEHRYADAIRLLRRALPLLGQDSELSSNLGLALQADGQYSAAIAAFRRAVALGPGFPQHHAYLASALRDAGALTEATVACEQAINMDTHYALPKFSRALCRLLEGHWRNLWLDHEQRYAADFGRDYAPVPGSPTLTLPRPSTWSGSLSPASHLFVLHEQGIGDELFFLRYAPLARARCGRLTYRAGTKLAPVLTGASGIDEIVPPDTLPGADDHVLLVGDLPLLCEPLPQVAPPPSLRLAPTADRVRAAQQRLAEAGPGPYLGVTWRAGPAPIAGAKPGRRKVVPVESLGTALTAWPGTVVSLQRHPEADEVRRLAGQLGRQVADLGDTNEDLPLMLALLSLLDEYVAVSNTNVHLRAAVGRSTRTLVSVPPDWRWTEQGLTSPWFPDFSLYREQRRGGWGPALAVLAADLRGA